MIHFRSQKYSNLSCKSRVAFKNKTSTKFDWQQKCVTDVKVENSNESQNRSEIFS